MQRILHRPIADVVTRLLLTLAGALLLSGWLGRGLAHATSDHLLSLRLDGRQLTGHWDVMLADLDYALHLDADGDGRVGNEELRVGGQTARDHLLAHLRVNTGGRPCPLTDTRMQVGRQSNGRFLRLSLAGTCEAVPTTLDVRNTLFTDTADGSRHRGYLSLTAGGQTQTGVFSPGRTTVSVSVVQPKVLSGLTRFVWLGMTHIWSGFDHLLFLITLLLPAVLRYRERRWTPVTDFRAALLSVLKVVTAFTLAHSLTLVLAALEVVCLPSRLVEAAIAVSVVLAALNNLFPVVGERRRAWVAFGFGLIHGFGFSSVLGELVQDRRALIESLIGFNLGVEMGQLAVVLLLVPVIFAARATPFYQRVFVRVAAALTVAVASVWFVQRLIG